MADHTGYESLAIPGSNADLGVPPTTLNPTQTPASRHRIGYARVPSVSFLDETMLMRTAEVSAGDSSEHAPQQIKASGLGIDVGDDARLKTPSLPTQMIPRTPVAARNGSSEQRTPDSSIPLMSPPSTGGFSGSTRFEESFDDVDTSYLGTKNIAKQSISSLPSTSTPSLYQASDRGLPRKSVTASVREQYDAYASQHVCSSSKHFKRGMNNWLAITIIFLALFSTIFSGLFLGIAQRKPRWDDRVGPNGTISVSSAAFLTSLFAKMIELSFVTVVVAFTGQLLSRRAWQKHPHPGVTLAEMSMRNWIVQPGTMVTHWETVRYAVLSWLGALALIAAIMAMLYTPASTALVQPQLKFSGWQDRVLQGDVWASFANEPYLEQTCQTPITTKFDNRADISDTCIQIEHASQAFHNYHHWMADWTEFAMSGNGTRDLATRPKGWALLNDNTTITAPWIEQIPQGQYKDTPWFINNVTMAMPHPGVVSAALNPANGMMQPDELNGLGIYSIRASVPVPFVNVICLTGITAEELKPLVFNEWDSVGDDEVNIYNWPDQLSDVESYIADPYLNGTAFDDVFRWGPKWGSNNWPPIFAKLPENFNSLVNDTTGVPWGRTAIYVLGKGGPKDTVGTPTTYNYGLCELRVGQTPNCTTQYNASSNVGTLEAICEDPHDDMRYIKSLTNATHGNLSVSAEWPNIASMWSRSLDLNTGLISGNASNGRLWSELILTNTSADWSVPADKITGEPQLALQQGLPSPAEALAVMSGCTLLQSAQDAPFVEFWNYSAPILNAPQTQYFNASVRAQSYASGGLPGYQQAFHVVLFAVFIINVVVLAYLLFHREWYQDFSDPTNLFSLAINSPPSEKLADSSCGSCSDKGDQYKHCWKLENNSGHVYIDSPEVNDMEDSSSLSRRMFATRFDKIASPVVKAAGRLRRRS